MRSYFAVCVTILTSFAASPALAQDNWSGAYVGAYVGGTQEETGFEDLACWTACTKPTVQGTSANVGISLGYDHQVADTLVIGLVGDFGTGQKRTLVEGISPPTATVGKISMDSDIAHQAAIRARAGMANGDTLFYVTGGVAFAKARFSARGEGMPTFWPGHSANFDATWNGHISGPVVGLGIEQKFGSFSARAEVLHSRFGKVSSCFSNSDGPNAGMCWRDNLPIPPQLDNTYNRTDFRVGIAYRF